MIKEKMIFHICYFLVHVLVSAYPPMEDPNLFEGDMILTPYQLKAIQNGHVNRDIPLAATKRPWPTVIPYDLYTLKYEPEARKVIQEAFEEYHKHTCLRFIPKTHETSFLKFMLENGCASSVGYTPGRYNMIALGKQCWKKGVVIHEIMHSLGFHHEQSRPDRDKYIKVHMENVLDYATNNFRKYGYNKIDSLGQPYDFSSVMHYGPSTFTKNNRTSITTIDPSKQSLIGQRNGLSKSDIIQINKLYKCKGRNPMTPPVFPTLDPNCSDKYALCNNYKQKCSSSSSDALTKWVLQNCMQTCGKCGRNPITPPVFPTLDPNCSDKYALCNNYKHKCSSSDALAKWVRQNCMRTCSKCGIVQ